jgi:hypothetical protein
VSQPVRFAPHAERDHRRERDHSRRLLRRPGLREPPRRARVVTNEKAHGGRRGPFRTANARKMRENPDSARAAVRPEIPCKSGETQQRLRTTENRGVPGSSPGLAIAKGLQTACLARRLAGRQISSEAPWAFSGLFGALDTGMHECRDAVDIRLIASSRAATGKPRGGARIIGDGLRADEYQGRMLGRP